ncbi:MAG TPA: hypothetical protein VGC41_23085 [Kofleriaceae bacterium]
MKRLCLAVLVACTPSIYRSPVKQPNYWSIDAKGARTDAYSRVNEWTSYGKHGLGAQAAFAKVYDEAEHAPPPHNEIEIFNASLPAGVSFEHGVVRIEKDANLEAIGKFEIGYWRDSAPHEQDIEPDLHRLAQVADGDVVVVETQRLDHADDRVGYMTGIVLRRQALAALTSAPATAHLVYEAAPGCPGADDFADLVSTKIGYSPWQPAAPELRTTVTKAEAGFTATVTFDRAKKQLTGATCAAALDAAAVAVAVELQPFQ